MACKECGDDRKLNQEGVCEYRPGCEHRQRVATAHQDRMVDAAERILSDESAPEFTVEMWSVDLDTGEWRRLL